MAHLVQTLRSRLTGLVAGSALLVGASMTPAQASDDQLLKLLLGATAVAVIVHTASRAQSQPRQSQPAHARGLPAQCRETLRIRGQHVSVYNAHCLQSAGFHRLPAQCHEVVRTNRGPRAVYRARCLERGVSAGRGDHRRAQILPDWCRTRYTYRGQRFSGYDGACLQSAGLGNLPATCQVGRHGGGIYSAQCLQDRGFRRR
ncbi:MAG: hypothetical protein EA339_06640 [Rhodobacteraceae bacterium]|nr:MAG: hypothetical protein EA339_06640 [Paracoccaceae bacterium]